MLLRKTLQRGKPLSVEITYEEPVRMQFNAGYFDKNIEIRSPITGDDGERYFSHRLKFLRYCLSGAFSVIMFIIVLGLVVVITAARIYIHHYCWLNKLIPGAPEFNFSQNAVGAVNAGQIIVFNAIYKSCALSLTKFENHKTYSQFLKSYSVKSIVFQ